MSTNVRHGYRIKLSDRHLLDFLEHLRATLGSVYRFVYGREVVTLAVTYADAYVRGDYLALPDPLERRHGEAPRVVSQYALGDATSVLDWYREHIKRSGQRAPEMDFSCEVVFLRDPLDPVFTYALLYTERDEYHSAFAGMTGVESYAYWDNVDHPNDVSEAAWAVRGATWYRVLPMVATPATVGLTWSLLGTGPLPHEDWRVRPHALTSYVPDVETRARLIAKRLADAALDAEREVYVAGPEQSAGEWAMRTLMAEAPRRAQLVDQYALEVAPTLGSFNAVDLIDLERLGVAPW